MPEKKHHHGAKKDESWKHITDDLVTKAQLTHVLTIIEKGLEDRIAANAAAAKEHGTVGNSSQADHYRGVTATERDMRALFQEAIASIDDGNSANDDNNKTDEEDDSGADSGVADDGDEDEAVHVEQQQEAKGAEEEPKVAPASGEVKKA
jgi:hypothetical protein